MLATVRSAALLGIDAFAVTVEVEVSGGQLPGYNVVGLAAAPVKEGAVRIRAALHQIGCAMPLQKVTVNLAPADRPKHGAAFDLPIAIGVLAGDSAGPSLAPLAGLLVAGELGLDGALRPIRGALAVAMLARRMGLRGVLLPGLSAAEAAVVEDIEVWAADHLGQVLAFLRGQAPLERARPRTDDGGSGEPMHDMADVQGQAKARVALEVAVAGGHNLLLVGPPGIGKTMLARRIPSILPPLTRDEALETTQIFSAVGLTRGGLVRERPFRAPHHSISQPALLGGGIFPKPGEISLAHNGVLFLDEMPEFSRSALEGLRQPLEDREVTVGRVHATVTMPASFLLVGSANPCPCGWAGSQLRQCTCSMMQSERYLKRLSGPLLDRIDLQVYVASVSYQDLRQSAPGEGSATIRARVVEARERQQHRLARWRCRTNAEMSARALRETCRLDVDAERTLARLHQVRTGMSARASTRLLKVARTIADLAGQDCIDAGCLREAAAYRALDVDREKNGPPRSSHGGPETSRCVVS